MVGACGADRCYKCVPGAGDYLVCQYDMTGPLINCNGNPCSGGTPPPTDKCAGKQCYDTCVGNDSYTQRCDPNTGNCVTNYLIRSNDPACGGGSGPTPAIIEVRNHNLGYGYVKVYKNGGYMGSSKELSHFNFNIGDTYKFEAIGENGWIFDKFCDKTYPIHIVCTPNNPFTGTVTEASGILNVFFKQSGGNGVGTATINVWRMTGAGEVSAYKGSTLLGTTSNGIGSFTFNVGDTFKFVATAGSGWTFEKYCSADPCSGGPFTTSNPFIDTVRQNGNLYVYFKQSGGNGGGQESWFCIQNTNTCELRNIAGGFATKALCEASGCSTTKRYDCNSAGQCVETFGGRFTTSNCNNSCSGGTPPPGDKCAGKQCYDTCVGNDSYTQRCDPNTGNCVTNYLIRSNDPACGGNGGDGGNGAPTCPEGETNLGGLLPECYDTITVALIGGLGLFLLTRK